MIDPALFRPDAVSTETRAFTDMLEAELAKVPPMHEVPAALTRQARLDGQGLAPAGGPLPGSEWRDAPTTPGRVRITAPEGAPKGLYIHIHGGGWTIGAPQLCDAWMRRFADEAGWLCASIEYRLAPENPWPACADDCEAGAVWAIETLAEEIGAERIAIGGESAGAHLSAVTLGRLKRRGLLNRVNGALLHYGIFDLSMTPSARNWGARNMILSTPTIEWFRANLGALDDADPDASPLQADLSDMPPALFQCGTLDPLLDDTLFMAQRWAAAGAEAAVEIIPGAPHAFDMFETEDAARARTSAAAFLQALA